MQDAGYNDLVFINCPFDNEYAPLLRSIVFAIYRCGFLPVTALNEDNGLQNRLSKIEDCIAQCRYGIHDLSRVELNPNNLPRFNMPFELGIFFGAKRFGDVHQKLKNALILDKDRYRYQQFISDLNGIDIKAHENEPRSVIRKIRDWLSNSSRREHLPGHLKIIEKHDQFLEELPKICAQLDLDINDIPFNDYCLIIEEALPNIFAKK